MISRHSLLGALTTVPTLTAVHAAGDAPDVLRIGYQKSGILSAVRKPGSVEATVWAGQNRDALAGIMAEATGVPLAARRLTVSRLGIAVAPMTDAVARSQQAIADTFRRLGPVPRAITVRDAVWAWPQS